MNKNNGCRPRALLAALGCAIAVTSGAASPGHAYTAAGDRLFSATLLLSQIAPGDEVYANVFDLPLSPGGPGTPRHLTNTNLTLQKTITERLSFSVDETWTRLDQVGGNSIYGWQNQSLGLKYLAVADPDREFLLSAAVSRELGGTGARAVGANTLGATTPTLFFGKGFGDFDIGYLRPFALLGQTGYQIADTRPRPNLVNVGFALQYSIPYLQSKVANIDMPEFMRSLTPMTEVQFNIPGGTSYGARTTGLVAPGVSYAGEGWELAVEGLIPLSRATGRGFGVTAQFHISLDFVAPTTIGKPLLSGL